MTAPFDITEIIPTKYKAWVGLIGSVLTLVVPFVLEAEQYLPTGANLAIGGVLAVLTSLGIYKAPYKPSNDTVLVHKSEVTTDLPAATPNKPLPPSGYNNPWA
jgi:hypothetical protein